MGAIAKDKASSIELFQILLMWCDGMIQQQISNLMSQAEGLQFPLYKYLPKVI